MNRRGFCAGLVAASLSGAAGAAPLETRGAPRDTRLLTTIALGGALKVRGYASAARLRDGPLVAPEAAPSLSPPGFGADTLDVVMKCFFATALLSVGHALAPRAVIGLYSPTLDFWWIAEARRAPTPKVLRAAFLPGGVLAGRAPSAAPRLVAETETRDLFEALRASTRAALAEFDAQFPRDGRGEAPALTAWLGRARPDLFAARLGDQVGALADFGASRALYAPLRDVLRALGQPNPAPPAELAPAARAGFLQIARADVPIRTALVPVGLFSAEERVFVISGNAATGRLLLVSAHRASAAPTLEQLALFDTRGE